MYLGELLDFLTRVLEHQRYLDYVDPHSLMSEVFMSCPTLPGYRHIPELFYICQKSVYIISL